VGTWPASRRTLTFMNCSTDLEASELERKRVLGSAGGAQRPWRGGLGVMPQPSLVCPTPGTWGTSPASPSVAPLFSLWRSGGTLATQFPPAVPPALALTGPGQLAGDEIVQERHGQPLPQEDLHQLGGHLLSALP